MKESDILYEAGKFWVMKSKIGFEVYKSGITHSTRCGQFGYKGTVGFNKAKAEADRRNKKEKS